MREYIQRSLEAHRTRTGRAYILGLLNRGGTLLGLPNERNELEPVKTEREMLEILVDGADFRSYIDAGLLELRVIRHDPIDSSQQLDKHREPDLRPLQDSYADVDGILGMNGTDSEAEAARFYHFMLPYNDPVTYWEKGITESNWTKGLILVSSQEPAATRRGELLIPLSGSDADINLVTGLMTLVDKVVGETGMMTNGDTVLQGVVAFKKSESHRPAFGGDPGIPPIAERTAFGMTYPTSKILPPRYDGRMVPRIITGADKYEPKVLTVTEDAHLEGCREYLDAMREGNDKVVEFKKPRLPQVILYVSKGAGNVQIDQYHILKQMEEQGVHIARVPLPGGRIPAQMHYAVPGADILGLNIEYKSARYKAQAVLALRDQLEIKPDKEKEFFQKMMLFRFGNEFLPNN